MLELKHISYSVREADETLGILKDISLTVDDHKLVVFTKNTGKYWLQKQQKTVGSGRNPHTVIP